MAPRKIIIDTDPGQDDAVAILLALASPELQVLGLTVVAGNVPLPLTASNARKVCELAGKPEAKVFAGADKPLVRALITAEHVHGRTGLDGPTLPEPTMALQPQHAVDFLAETLRREPAASVTLVGIGPLTNIALALQRAPEIAPRIQEIVVMGGSVHEGGNVTPAAEFNMHVDPHAAHAVLTAGVPTTLMPLDVTHQALATPERIAAIRALGSPVADAVAAMLTSSERVEEQRFGTRGAPLHDPCTIAWLLKPALFAGRDCNVAVEHDSELSMGATVIDWWDATDRPKNARVMRDIDADGYFALVTERLGRY
jgi:purine nucleosidase